MTSSVFTALLQVHCFIDGIYSANDMVEQLGRVHGRPLPAGADRVNRVLSLFHIWYLDNCYDICTQSISPYLHILVYKFLSTGQVQTLFCNCLDARLVKAMSDSLFVS